MLTVEYYYDLTAPSGPPDNITTTALTSTQILVSWDLPLPHFRNGPILAYNLTVTDTTTGMVVWSSTVLTTSATVSSLRAFTTYNFTLSARTSVGYGPNDTVSEITLQDSKLVSVKMAQLLYSCMLACATVNGCTMIYTISYALSNATAPSSPTNPIVDVVNGDPYSLRVSWMSPAVPNGYITHYNAYCQESQLVFGSGIGGGMLALPTSLYPSTFTSTVYGTELNATISGLIPFTNYGCYVSANTSIGEGNNSISVFQITDEYSKIYIQRHFASKDLTHCTIAKRC